MANHPIQLDVPGLAPDTSDATRLRLIGSLLGTEVSDATKLTLARVTDPATLIALVLGSPEFQRH
jgi:hypothetical protein